MSKEKIMKLTIKESKVHGSGTIRIPKSAFELLQIKRGERVVISSGKKTRIIRAYGSELVEASVIYLRRPEMQALEVQEGDVIRVDRLTTVPKILAEKTRPATKRIKRGIKSVKERLSSEEKKGKRKK
jgi:bifunctional DNA-binding transcriptional regulator/antitoxin component of YhaV-PrlF toxin-antitoxin module